MGMYVVSIFFTVVYAKCSKIKRRLLWEDLVDISYIVDPWLVRGDFNIIRKTEKRLGGNPMDFIAAGEFNDCIADNGLLELNFISIQFTWKKSNAQCGNAWITCFVIPVG